ncbi:MAG TPA: 3-hydroxyacyl-ACP dehydratase FabZ family protein [Pirellulaceae bacterium]|nr:3-hydroxyacyl-ACP dehydratase FabZ family protein [Pirellulaceae bacterium]
MRWFWIDRFLEFKKGQRAIAIKCVALAEEQLDDYVPGYPLMPNSLIVEGMAQTGGLLVGEMNEFRERVVLAKLGKAVFHRPAMAGDTLRYTADVQDVKPDGAIVHTTCHIGDELQSEVEMVFAHLDEQRFSGVDLFEPADFLRMLRLFGLFDVGVDAAGERLYPPQHMLTAEAAYNAKAPAARP